MIPLEIIGWLQRKLGVERKLWVTVVSNSARLPAALSSRGVMGYNLLWCVTGLENPTTETLQQNASEFSKLVVDYDMWKPVDWILPRSCPFGF